MKIGILGGTFDPPHKGHAALANAALECLELDEVLFIPANRNPNKSGKREASAKDRLEMVRLMIESEPKFSVSDIEIRRGGPSYTIETLEELSYLQPAEYWFLIGADSLRTFENWKQPQKILRLCRLGVAIRPPDTWDEVHSRISPEIKDKMDPVPMAAVDISSTEVRARLHEKTGVQLWISAPVLQYIREHKLYEN